MVWHLSKLNLLNVDFVEKSFSTYTSDRSDSGLGEIDYDIVRYRNLSINDVLMELGDE